MRFLKVLGATALPLAALTLTSCNDDSLDLNAESILEAVENTFDGLENSLLTFTNENGDSNTLRLFVDEIKGYNVEIAILDDEYALVSDYDVELPTLDSGIVDLPNVDFNIDFIGSWLLSDEEWTRQLSVDRFYVEDMFGIVFEAALKLVLVELTADEYFDDITINAQSIEFTILGEPLIAYFTSNNGDLVITAISFEGTTTCFNLTPNAVPATLITAITEHLTVAEAE